MHNKPTVEEIILTVMEIESGRKLIGHSIGPNDTNGGYTNDPDDPGGETNWGWTETTLKTHGIKTHPRDLTFQQAFDYYRRIFWVRSGAMAVYDFQPWLARTIFNYAVHAGYSKAARNLQLLLNLHNNRGKRWPDLIVDGAVGKQTLAALQAYIRLRKGEIGEDVLFTDYAIMMGAFYQTLAIKNDRYEKYTYGWSTRAMLELKEYFTRN